MASPSSGYRPSLVRLETRAVEEDARKKSTRQLWRQHFEEFTEWLSGQGEEMVYARLDDQLTEFLRKKYFEGKSRSYAVNTIRAVKFEVPPELGRDSLGRARSAVARWDSLPFVELDPDKIRATGLQAIGSAALCDQLGHQLGLGPMLYLRRTARGMPAAVDSALHRAFKDHVPHVKAEDWRGCKPLRKDFQDFLTGRLASPAQGAEGGEVAENPAMRLVIRDSPAFLQMEMAGSASFQMDGSLALLGKDLLEINVDTAGLWFRTPQQKDVHLLQANNLDASYTGHGPDSAEVADLGSRLRRFLDPKQVSHAVQLLNPGTLSTLAMLFPDAKYDVALVQDTFHHYDPEAPYALEETNWLKRLKGSPRDCFLSHSRADIEETSHLLKTQEHLDPKRVEFYSAQLQEALATGSSARPTALVLDFFNTGQIHRPQPDEGDAVVGPGGRRIQTRRRTACENGYLDHSVNPRRTWILLDGHHKVEAAARLGCTMNFLVFCPCAEPYEPLCANDPCAPTLAKTVVLPTLWPSQGTPVADWETARLCSCVAMRLSSSRQLSEAWVCKQCCRCFDREDAGLPPWGYGMLSSARGGVTSRGALIKHCKQVFGESHELFTTYQNATMAALPQDLQMQLYREAFDLSRKP